MVQRVDDYRYTRLSHDPQFLDLPSSRSVRQCFRLQGEAKRLEDPVVLPKSADSDLFQRCRSGARTMSLREWLRIP